MVTRHMRAFDCPGSVSIGTVSTYLPLGDLDGCCWLAGAPSRSEQPAVSNARPIAVASKPAHSAGLPLVFAIGSPGCFEGKYSISLAGRPPFESARRRTQVLDTVPSPFLTEEST